jgi:hypothetical protein
MVLKSNVLPCVKKDVDKKRVRKKIKDAVSELESNYMVGDEMRVCHIIEAEEIVTGLIFGKAKKKEKATKLITSILISASTQSGKTGLIIAMSRLLKDITPKLKVYVFCANEQREYKDQINNALGGLVDVKYLSLRDRDNVIEDIVKINLSNPNLFIYDESHYGECTYQTSFRFLTKCGLFIENKDGTFTKNPVFKNLVICVSATGFSGFEFVDRHYVRDVMELSKYNSITQLLADKKVFDCDRFITEDDSKIKIHGKSNVLTYLDDCLVNFSNKKINECYAILRCRSKEHSKKLALWLEKKYGSKVNAMYWNQKNPLPSGFLNRPRQVFTVILIQNMARMGITINTKYIALMAESIPNKSYLATIVQSVLGRATGFDKRQHNIRIFSNIQHAEAYSLHERGLESAFKDFCAKNKIKLSNRCKYQSILDTNAVKIQHYLFPADRTTLLGKLKESDIAKVKMTAKSLATSIVDEAIKLLIRTKYRQQNNFPFRCEDSTSKERLRIKGLFNPLEVDNVGGVEASAGSIAGVIYRSADAKEVRSYKIPNVKEIGDTRGRCKLVKVIMRLEEGNAYKTLIKPKDESMYSVN